MWTSQALSERPLGDQLLGMQPIFLGSLVSSWCCTNTPEACKPPGAELNRFCQYFPCLYFGDRVSCSQDGLYLTVTEACLWLPTTSQVLASQACTIPPGSHFLKSVHLETRAGGDILSPPHQIVLTFQTPLFFCTMTWPGKK